MKYLFPIVLLLCILGCSSSNPQGRIPISGTVTLDGKPIAEGLIHFVSAPGQAPAMETGTVITDGKFETTAEGGLIPSQTYIVSFTATEKIPGTERQEGDRTTYQSRNIIPPKWGVNSQETIVCEKEKKDYNFDLTTK